MEVKKRGEEQWIPAVSRPVPECKFTVTDLTTNEQYMFHVMAENQAGRSDPCKPTHLVTVKDSPGK